jgi:hypothetical protein
MNKPKTTTNTSRPISAPGRNKVTPTIDIELLAEKVYQLMQADIRQTRARNGMQCKGSNTW